MERTTTARIDLQKLQVLNDRLALCLDALHQVRLSAHAPAAQLGFMPGQQIGYGVNPIAQSWAQQFGYGVNPIAQSWAQQFGYGVNPIGYSPVAGYGIPAWNTAVHGMGIPTTPWHVAGTYGVEARPGYTNGAFAPAYAPAPTSQVW